MSDIIVRKNGNKWGGYFEDKHIVSGGCKPCIIHALIRVMEKSEKFKRVIVMHENNRDIEQTIEIGADSARNIENTQRQG